MDSVIKLYNPGGVDEGVLQGTGTGGLLDDGYLKEDPIDAYLGSDETPVFALSNGKSGVSYEHEDGSDDGRIRPGDGYRAFAVVTDVRLLFIVGDIESGDDSGDRSVTVPLTDIELVDGSGGVLSSTLSVRTTPGVHWEFPTRRDLDSVVEYLEVASMTWMNVERRLDDARKRLVDATQALESRSYDEAMDALREAMAETDAARRREREFCEDGVHAMADRIETTEERIREVRLRILRGRATHNIDEAERRWRAESYDAAYSAYSDAHDDYVEALAVRDPGFEESADLRDKLARVERNMAYLEQAPIDSAETAREAAAEAEDRAERVDHLETALERYRTALELDWGRDLKRFECDTEEVRERIDDVATDIVDLRQAAAAEHVRRANDHYEAGRYRRARDCYGSGREQLRAMLDVARELVPDTAAEVTERLEAIDDRLAEIDARLDDDGDDVFLAPSELDGAESDARI